MKNNELIARIAPISREKWQGHEINFNYKSNNYYNVEITRTHDNFNVTFTKNPFDKPYIHKPTYPDKLFAHWLDDVMAWGIEDGDRLLAVIETSVEEWNNRLRVTELWVDEAYKRKGIATELMDIAIKRAEDEGRRVVVLEVQSCNEAAIAFYLAYGLTLIGFDACAYRNDDISRKEVRLEMGFFL
ncbi:MAG: GNAT family N-acetyltransferase [Defluviitaleaceae bacterium]|nr:GNAT family N-acetyltransferase [Defluviitaleaceae bacterium]